ARAADGAPAPGARARVLRRPDPVRARGAPGRADRHHPVAHARRTGAAARATRRSGGRVMARPEVMTHDELAALVSAHALHALDPEEAAMVERLIESAPEWRAAFQD